MEEPHVTSNQPLIHSQMSRKRSFNEHYKKTENWHAMHLFFKQEIHLFGSEQGSTELILSDT